MQQVTITMSCATRLEQEGFKLTLQRRVILDAIHDAHAHLTAEDIIGYVQTRVPGVKRSTVYRTLELLDELGCVFKSEISGRFVYHHAEEGHHHHLLCRSCGRMVDCDENMFSPVEESLKSRYGFQADFKHMVVRGLCQVCREKG